MAPILLTIIAVMPLASVAASAGGDADAHASFELAAGRGDTQPGERNAAEIAGPRPAQAKSAPARAPGSILRCWQHGRLLFEEEVTDAPDSAKLRLRLNDRERSPLVLFELNGALCSVRRAPGTGAAPGLAPPAE